MKPFVRIGTRASQLALYQTEWVETKLKTVLPLIGTEVIKIKTSGDMIRRRKADPFDTKAVYVREIENALLEGSIDLAVHSAKDMSVALPAGLKIAAVLAREDARDCFVSTDGRTLSELGPGARIGTSSLRRKMQILRLHPGLAVEELHGNVESRLKHLHAGEYDGLVLAYAGLKRLGLTGPVTEIFSETAFYPSPGQGAIVVESRDPDPELDEITGLLNDEISQVRLLCERAFLKRLEGGCELPCGIWTRDEESVLKSGGALFSLDNSDCVEDEAEGALTEPVETGVRLAETLLEKGGRQIIEKIRMGHDKS